MSLPTPMHRVSKWTFQAVVAGLVLVLIAFGLAAVGGPLRLLGMLLGLMGVAAIAIVVYSQRHTWKNLAVARSLRYGTNAVVLTLAVLAIVVFINVLAGQYRWRLDLTANKQFTLASQTVSILRELEQPIKAYAFVQDSYEGSQVKQLLKEYSLATDRFTYEVIDPNKKPAVAQQFDVDMINTVVFEAGSEIRKVYSWDIFGYSQTTQAQEFQGEQAFTRAIRDVTRGKSGKIYFMTSHGERNLNMEYRQVRTYLEGEGYEVEELNVAEKAGVPQDASVVVLAGPQRDYTSAEIDALQRHAMTGGRLMVLLDPPGRGQPIPGVEKWVAQWGVLARHDLVVDPERRYFIDPFSPIPQWEYHKTTRDLMSERVGIVVPRSRSLAQAEVVPEGYELTRLMKTSDASWGEVNYASERASKDSSDHEGPLALGYAIALRETGDDASGQERGARILVMGSSAWITGDVISFQGNMDFFVNAINWLSGREEMLSIRPKAPDYRLVQLSGASATAILYSTVVFMPLIVLLVGGAIWWRRRSL